ncbi:MAG TPA: S24 family peptidase [Lacipirellulaceae bacterium]|nr:S24 family peptidase [Lacipirellulaceae bacterium]
MNLPAYAHASFRDEGLDPAFLGCMKMVGDSMAPEIKPGEWFVFDKQHTMPSPEGLFVIDGPCGLDVARLQWRPELKKVTQSRVNAAYLSVDLDPDAVCVVGRVVAVMKRV